MKKKDILFILISGFFIVIAWIGFSIYHNSKTSTIPEATSIQIAPITPAFDTETIEDIKRRIKAEAILERKTTPTATATSSATAISPTPTISPTPSEETQNVVTPTPI